MRQRLPMVLSVTALIIATLGWTGLGEAAKNSLFVPRNSITSKHIKNRTIQFKDLSLNARFKLARDARVQLGPSSSLEGRVDTMELEVGRLERKVENLCQSSSGAVRFDGFPVSC